MSQTLKFGNGTWATKKGSTLAYNDEDGNFKPLPFTYTGAGKGTRVNKEGLIEVVENDRPRIDYTDSEDGVFLLEKAATNLITYSEDFSNAYWTKSGSSVVSGFISPKGDLSAFKLVESSTTSTHELEAIGIAVVADKYTISLFAKAGERGKLQVKLRNYFAGDPSVIFDLENGTFEQNVQAIGSMTLLSNGFYKCTFTTVLNAIAGGNAILNVNLVDEVNQTSYTGDGTSGIYIYGAMLEQSSQSSSYIPTQGTIQTRVQETASGSGNSEVFNSEQGVLFANIAANNDSQYKSISLSNASSSGDDNRVLIALQNSNLNANVRVGNVYQFNKNFTLSTENSNKIALKYKTNDFALWVNGFEVSTDTSGITFSNGILLKMQFADGRPTTSPFYGKTKEISYYDEILTDEELEYMTSYRTWEAMVKELNLNIIHNE